MTALPRRHARAFGPLVLVAALVACAEDPIEPPRPATVDESLAAFGVDLTPTPRVDDQQEPLPESYSPFGTTRSFDTQDEIALIGVRLAASEGFDGAVHLLELEPDDGNELFPTVLASRAQEETPWARPLDGADLRDAAALDADGDGLDELVVVTAKANVGPVEVRVLGDATDGFGGGEAVLSLARAPRDLAVAAGDFDGDGRGDVVLALAFADSVEVLALENDGAGSFTAGGMGVTVPRVSPDGELYATVASGNLDHDAPWEIAVVVNERFTSGDLESGSARYFVFDDQTTDYAELAGDAPIRVDGDDTTRTAITGDVAIGDLDADGVDELVVGGLSAFPVAGCTYEYVLVALDDARRELAPLGGTVVERTPFGSCDGGELRTLAVGMLDVDGDGGLEVHANGVLFDDFRSAPPFSQLATVPFEALFAGSAEDGFRGRVDRHTLTFATGDVTLDRRQDLLFVSQATGGLRVWGLDMIDGWTEIVRTPLEDFDPAVPLRPVLATPNADRDSLALSYDDGEYRLVFTEPVLIAALAAPPCDETLGQNLDACRTSFGTAESTTVEREDTWTITASASVGLSTSFSAFGVEVSAFEAVATVRASYAKTTSSAYTLTQRVEYTTGPNEDGVIFTTIPYDQYTYTILSHPEPELIGEQIVVSLPREPVQILVTRDFYNRTIEEGAIPIDESIFAHVPGQVDSYRTAADRDGLLERFEGLLSDQVDVGQGGGSIGVGLNVFEETGSTSSYGVEAELDVRATIGAVVVGFSVGGGLENSLRVSHGAESDYAGTVSNMSQEAFSSSSFSYGMFTYVRDDIGQPFEVVDYWVE